MEASSSVKDPPHGGTTMGADGAGLDAAAGHGRPLKPFAVETVLMCLLSAVMILLPIVSIVLRRLNLDNGISVYTQHATLWLGFLGAVLATGGARHLGLATTSFIPEGRWRTRAVALGSVVSAVVCVFLTWASVKVIDSRREGLSTMPGGVKTWWSECIVPVAFALMALRFIWHTPGPTPSEKDGGWRGRAIALAACVVAVLAFSLLGATAQALFWPGIVGIVVSFLLGAPIFVVMAGTAMLFFFHAEDGTIAAVPEELLRLVQNPTLPAIPLLTLAGYVLAAGRASERLVRAYKSMFGWMPGGVALMALSVCALFTTFTGGSGVTILALGGVLAPALLRDKYPEGFSYGLLTAAGSLGLLFPPSLPVILYGAVAGVAPDKLYLAGLVPGLLLVVVVGLWSIRAGIAAKTPRQAFQGREVIASLWAAKWDLGLPVVVVAPFVAGLATVLESAAIGALYAFIVELGIHRHVHPTKQMPKVVVQSATLVGAVVVLMGVALGLSNYLVDRQIPEALVEWVQTHFKSSWSFLLVLNGMLLVLGSVFEIYAAIIVLAPLIAPLAAVFEIDPVHLGVVFLANLELGFLFPPMGLNLLLSGSRFGKSLPWLYRQALPFLLIMAGGVLVITYVPAMTSGVVALFRR
jgi:tripartite ATP-independent transporter DctM subunit